jgi:hypothetical protein
VRLSDADREEVFERLAEHAAAGRLSTQELEARVAAAAAAQTQAEIAPLLADLPPASGPAAGDGPRRRLSRSGGHAEHETPDPSWQATSERFRDPRSQRVVRVWVDSAGARHYVREP